MKGETISTLAEESTMSTAQAEKTGSPLALETENEVRIYAHTSLIYWWPVWAVGYLLAMLTWAQGEPTKFADFEVLIHPSKNLGVIYTMTFFLVILMTNVSLRGYASATFVAVLVSLTFAFAWFGWWGDIFHAFNNLAIFMNFGFYLFFSTAVFLVWAANTFIFDRLDYWKFRPGQVVHIRVFGGGEETFDTHGMSVQKLQDDIFRHWVLGLGSGDMLIAITGAKKEEVVVPNVMFIESKLRKIQRLVAMKPDQTQNTTVLGDPS